MTTNTAPTEFAYCPRCATALETRFFIDKPRRVCPGCGYVHFTDPKVGVGVVVLHEGNLLLVQRKMKPEQGKWSVPAGFVDQGEDPRETAVREAFEETNLQVVITEVVDVYFNPPMDGFVGTIFIMYRAKLLNGELQAGDDAADAAFFSLDDLPELAFTSTKDAVARLRAGQAHS